MTLYAQIVRIIRNDKPCAHGRTEIRRAKRYGSRPTLTRSIRAVLFILEIDCKSVIYVISYVVELGKPDDGIAVQIQNAIRNHARAVRVS